MNHSSTKKDLKQKSNDGNCQTYKNVLNDFSRMSLSNISILCITITAPLLQRLPNLIADELSMIRTNTNTSVTLSRISALKNRSPNHVVLEYTEIKDKRSLVFRASIGEFLVV